MNPKNCSISFRKSSGFVIIDAVIGVIIGTIILTAFATLILNGIKISRVNNSELKAKMYLQELIEVAKDLEQSEWGELTDGTCATPTVCHVSSDDNIWNLVPGEEPLENNTYIRSLTIEDVCRNSDKEIDTCPSYEISTSTKKVIARITWNDGFRDRNLILETYVYKY